MHQTSEPSLQHDHLAGRVSAERPRLGTIHGEAEMEAPHLDVLWGRIQPTGERRLVAYAEVKPLSA